MPNLCANKNCRAELPEGRKNIHCADCNRVWDARRYERTRKEQCERARRYREEHSEHLLEYNERYYEGRRAELCEKSRKWRQNNPDKVKSIHQARRARKKGTMVGPVDIALVRQRSAGCCVLCGLPVERQFQHIDHVVPLSKGGPHTQDNLQLLCRGCNQKKGAKMPG